MKQKTAVVLFNLGGPDSLETVRPFLYNLFSDPDIFKLPLGFITQKPFAWLISKRREAAAKKNYAAIGGKSPLAENTQEQAIALQLLLAESDPDHEYLTFVCMRYWHPLTREVVRELKERKLEKIILLPLYPQYSITTTGSSYNEFQRECRRQRYHPETHLIHDWYDSDDYQQAIIECIKTEAKKFSDPNPKNIELLFSAHGLPQKIVDAGDPYEQHIRATYESVKEKLQWPRTSLCYQSRVGPLKWLQPYTDRIIEEKAKAGVKQMLVYPIAFVSDHVETLFELGMEYAELAKAHGITEYRVVPALNSHPLLIDTLEQIVLETDNS